MGKYSHVVILGVSMGKYSCVVILGIFMGKYSCGCTRNIHG